MVRWRYYSSGKNGTLGQQSCSQGPGSGPCFYMANLYETVYQHSLDDPESFWAEQAALIDWDTPWEKVNTHPRSVGAHAKVLRLSREKQLLPLMTAISKMSYQYAKFLEDNGVEQMANKGRIKVGADADITIFDPETVRDNSELKPGRNSQPSTGIPYVIVNGTVVVKDSKVQKDVYPGQPIRNATID